MPIRLGFRPSFERSLKHLGSENLKTVVLILKALEAYYAADCDLQAGRSVTPAFFYKQLRKPFFEAGIDSRIRVVLGREGSACAAFVAGNHDQIRAFLKKF